MQRVVLAASMAVGETRIKERSYSADDKACIEVIQAMGARVEQDEDVLCIRGRGLNYATILDCGESGFCFRASIALAALKDRSIKLIARGSLVGRPICMVYKPLLQLGVSCEINGCTAPVTVRGPLIGGRAAVNGAVSSQFLSGLLLALPNARGDTELSVTKLCSKPYIRMTLNTMAEFGIRLEVDEGLNKFIISGNQNYIASAVDTVIEGDWSGASFMLVAGAIAGEVVVTGLKRDSLQADRAILNVLELSGAKVCWNSEGIVVSNNDLKSFNFDATDCPDLFPPLVVLACCAKGTSRIYGVVRLMHKESNRGVVLVSVFSNLGASIRICGDVMEITGGPMLGGTVHSNNDHRIAMACAVAGLITKFGVTIVGETCVLKSYPDFFHALQSIRDRV